MLNITITEQTSGNMLRAIRAACNELLGETTAERSIGWNAGNTAAPGDFSEEIAADAQTASNAQGGPVDAGQFYRVGEQALNPEPPATPETDSTGTEWNPELHASTKAKNQDGTWKKRRGAGKAEDVPELPSLPLGGQVPPGVPDSPPPLPPVPPAAPLVTMNDIYALITNGKAVLNDVIAGAQAMGFPDVGAFSRDATPEQRAQLLAQLTKEVA